MEGKTYPPPPETLDGSIFSVQNIERIRRNVVVIVEVAGGAACSGFEIVLSPVRRVLEGRHRSKICRRRDGTVSYFLVAPPSPSLLIQSNTTRQLSLYTVASCSPTCYDSLSSVQPLIQRRENLLGLAMQGMDESNSEQIPRAHPSTPPESQPSARPVSAQPNEGARRSHRSYSRILYRRRHMRRRLRSATQTRTKGQITHFSRSRKASVRPIASCPDPPASTVYSSSGSNSVNLTGLGYDSEADRVVCSDEAWQSFIKEHPLCKHLRYEGLRHKELQYNVFEKTHAAGAYGYGSVMMGDGSNPSVDYDFNFANSETHPCLEEDVTPTAGGRLADTRQGPDVAGPSRRSGSLGKRKQRDATDTMAYEAMEEVRDYF
ncbi:hypothetical protein TIFTF001_024371 [Ficus carica]|uniref:Uncharacterized protein n=1 Tax=Ficus carica TaxID=3494 RepID=A0AA88DKC9_FICCA|nr:hypothetical protein TIFTF001_024371 [Ficus carica]